MIDMYHRLKKFLMENNYLPCLKFSIFWSVVEAIIKVNIYVQEETKFMFAESTEGSSKSLSTMSLDKREAINCLNSYIFLLLLYGSIFSCYEMLLHHKI